jgi:hypothetical protein
VPKQRARREGRPEQPETEESTQTKES